MLVKVKRHLAKMKAERLGVHHWFVDTVEKYPNKIAIACADSSERWTFRQLDDYANRIARLFRSLDFHPGDVVCIFMENTPQYPAIYLGLAKIGVVSSLINYNLRSDSLAHCIAASSPKAVIFTSSLARHVIELNIHDILFFCLDGNVSGSESLDARLASHGSAPLPMMHSPDPEETVVYIFTSGTTGLPKPARISHNRFYYFGSGMALLQQFRHDDIIYATLPMYHSNGSCVPMGVMIQLGLTLVVRKKFSASRFWDECYEQKCSVWIVDLVEPSAVIYDSLGFSLHWRNLSLSSGPAIKTCREAASHSKMLWQRSSKVALG